MACAQPIWSLCVCLCEWEWACVWRARKLPEMNLIGFNVDRSVRALRLHDEAKLARAELVERVR